MGYALPTSDGTAGQVITTDGAGKASYASPITLDTAQVTTSGTAFDFTGISAGAKRITVIFNEVSLSGTGDLLVQLGDAGGIEATTYASTSVSIDASSTQLSTTTTGFIVRSANASTLISVVMTIVRISGNVWIASHSGKGLTTFVITGGGSKTTSAELTQLRVTRTGADTFDAGSVNIMYEV